LALLPAVVTGAVFWIGYDAGTYGAVDRGAVALGIWWALALGLTAGVWPLLRPPGDAILVGVLLAAFVALVGLSSFWAESVEHAVTELDRALLYLGVFTVAVVAAPLASAHRLAAGLAAGISGVAILALASRLFPDLADTTEQLAQIFSAAERRLSYPVNYWNGLATLSGFALPLLLALAIGVRTHPALRGAALTPVPAIVSTIYLTSSRGGALATAFGVAVFLVLTARRPAAVWASLVAGAGATAAVLVLADRPDLVDRPLQSASAADQGRSAAFLIGLACLAVGVLYAVSTLLPIRPPAFSPLAQGGVGLLIAAAIIVAVVLADPVERFERFKESPPELAQASVREHLFSGSGNGRWQLWQAAWEEFESRPLVGRGAGSYEAWWSEHGSLPIFVRDAHSLYLETLGELGVTGLALLVAFFAACLAAAVRRWHASAGDGRAAIAAFTGIVVAYLAEAAVDWMWEMTVVSVVAFAALGALTGPATLWEPRRHEPRSRRRTRLLRAGGAVVAVATMLIVAAPLLATVQLRSSQDAAERGDLPGAVDHALAAQSLEPWAASPRLQLALVRERSGQLDEAEEAVTQALERDPTDWRIWLTAARIRTKNGEFEQAQESLDRAVRLNPRSPLFADQR
jgi:O-antigen ligase